MRTRVTTCTERCSHFRSKFIPKKAHLGHSKFKYSVKGSLLCPKYAFYIHLILGVSFKSGFTVLYCSSRLLREKCACVIACACGVYVCVFCYACFAFKSLCVRNKLAIHYYEILSPKLAWFNPLTWHTGLCGIALGGGRGHPVLRRGYTWDPWTTLGGREGGREGGGPKRSRIGSVQQIPLKASFTPGI